MLATWQFLASLPTQDIFYAKILYDKETTAYLNRNNFPLYIAAAVDAAKFKTPSMANYGSAEGQVQSSTMLGNIVQGYLTHRLSLSTTAVINEFALI